MKQYLQQTEYFNFDHPLVKNLVAEVCTGLENPVEIACHLYRAVRDGFRYDPYSFSSNSQSFYASHVVEKGAGYCIPKAVLLGAAARAQGIPSRLGLADVRNHLSDENFVQQLKSDVFTMHGYIELFLEGTWVKATPAFNKTLCQRFRVEPLDFNGREDSVFQEYNGERRYMEYLRDYGHFEDLPRKFIVDKFIEAYPHLQNRIEQGLWIERP